MKKIDFNDDWKCNGKPVFLPHDAMIEEGRDPSAASGSAGGYYLGGVYEYEKILSVPKEWKDKHIILQFDGVYKNCSLMVNGIEVSTTAYGYIPFFADITAHLNYEKENRITVIARNDDQPNSRWYTGSGIYRPVHLWICKNDGLRSQEIRITTLSVSPAKIKVEMKHDADIEIMDNKDVIAYGHGKETVIEIPDADLWSDETPNLYTCRVRYKDEIIEEKFGIRKIEWSNKGLFINGKETLLRGGCIHHDHGILGARAFKESEYRRIRILKEAGYNALRIAHNPAAAYTLEACDYYGMYVIDETWDCWYAHKNKNDYASDFKEHFQDDIQAMVQRDYNHPSVIMYSIGNEVSEPADTDGLSMEKQLVYLFRQLDQSRAVTAGFNLMILAKASKGKKMYKEDGGMNEDTDKTNGMNSTMFNLIASFVGTGMNNAANSKKADIATSPALNELDICGYNYASGRYPLEGKIHPQRIIYGSETFPQDLAKNWKMVEKYPYLIGDFMWTAWDYLGEAGIGAWGYGNDARGFNKTYPWMLADTGAFDILGNPNGELFWAQAIWHKLRKPAIAVRPMNHDEKMYKGTWRGTNAIKGWSYQGCEGRKTVVEVYFDCFRIALYLNGAVIGSKRVKDCRAGFKTKYIPGKLEAIAFDEDNHEIARSEISTCKNRQIHVFPEKEIVHEGEILYVSVTIGDGKNIERNADRKLTVKVTGGELLAFGSADPKPRESFLSGTYTTYYGQALAVIRAGNKGKMEIMIDKIKTCINVI